MTDRVNKSYGVGYRHPPKEHQFQPGCSGNPSGRPKGARNLKTELLEELSELVMVSDGSGTIEVSKARAVVKTLLRLAIGGDQRAIATVMASCARGFDEDNTGDGSDTPEDAAIVQAVTGKPKRKSARAPAFRGEEG